MDRRNSTDPSSYGLITIEDRNAEGLRFQDAGTAGGAVLARHRYSWRPPRDVEAQLPDRFAIEFDCYVTSDGVRTFVPVAPELFIHQAFIAGLEILAALGRVDSRTHHSYCAMKLIFNAVRKRQTHFKRAFNHVRDLYIRLPGRQSRDERSILPSDLGKTADGRGRTWSIQQLRAHGREEAIESGITTPTTPQCIMFGFLAAARRNPLHISGRDLRLLVRTALYDLPSGKRPSRTLVNEVSERILIAVQRHLVDGTVEFHKWFDGPHSNFLKSIAEQPNSRGGALSREDVGRVFLDLGFKAYGYVANCLQAFGKWFQKALPVKLTSDEKQDFENRFMQQQYLGGMPLLLLKERTPFIRAALEEIWQDPSRREPKRVLHRLLHYFAQLVANRRAADRQFKPKGADKKKAKKYVSNLGSDDRNVVLPRNDQPDLCAIVGRIRAQRRLPAHCRCGPLKIEVVERKRGKTTLQCKCDCGAIDEMLVATLSELRKVARDL